MRLHTLLPGNGSTIIEQVLLFVLIAVAVATASARLAPLLGF